jgi:hypothetical protein
MHASQFQIQNCGLQIVEPTIETPFGDFTACRSAVIAQPGNAVGDFGIRSDYGAGIAVGAQQFGGIETECGGSAEGACADAVIRCAECLGGIFDQDEVMFLCKLQQRLHVTDATVQMNRQDCFGARSDCGCGGVGIHQVVIADIDEHRLRAGVMNGGGGGYKCVGNGDYFVAWAVANTGATFSGRVAESLAKWAIITP